MEREDRVVLAAYRCLYEQVVELGGVTVLREPEAPQSPMLNRVIGLGSDEPASEARLDEALAAMGNEVSCYVALAPGAQPPALTGWLRERGFDEGWGWMTFHRGVDELPAHETSLRLVRVGREEGVAFGEIVATAYDLPEAIARRAATFHTLGWECWLALDGDEPAAAAGVFVRDGVGYLGFAATLPEHRGKGGQGALLAVRIRHAREAGCDVLVTETGERRDDRPSNSYRNILRAGFTEAGVTANWLRPGRGMRLAPTQTP